MTRHLTGHWAYTIQGVMQYLNPFNLRPEKPKTLEVGLALKNDLRFKDQYNFYDNFSTIPLAVLNLKPFDPPRDTFPLPFFNFSSNFPWISFRPPFTSTNTISGYMPFAESGHMRFSPDGTITGKLWFTLAGYTTYSSPFFIAGRYEFRPDLEDGITFPVGAITLLFERSDPHIDLSQFVWDYTFIMVSNDEIQITTAGRFPRPATAAGTMKRMQASAFVEPPAGPIGAGAPAPPR